MARFLLLLPLLLLAPVRQSAQPSVSQQAAPQKPKVPDGFHQVKLNGHHFTLPDGFTIEVAAGVPLVERPIVAAFDEKGILYVCDSSGSNEPAAVQAKKKPHRIVRLQDSDGDGRFDKSNVFVANVMFPEGAMWFNGSLYVAAPPRIMKFTDAGNGVAGEGETWFDGKTLTGCANDLHGPYLGPDGWIYWCKGAFAKQEYTLPNGKKFSTRAAHIFRAKPDGSKFEPVMTGGMDNPVDVVFTPGGERIFSTTFFQHPGNGKRDGLVHAIYGGVYGKDHDPVYEHPWTSPTLMPVMTHMGPAAPCGLHRYESDQFGKEFENNIFCTQFNMRKVSRHVLVPSGSTFTTRDSDFVVSDNLDFHPTDVIEDADGSLLIIDTGGWYKLCCPTSQLVKPDINGAIYRVKKIGAHKVEDPRGLKIAWNEQSVKELGHLLHDPRPAVQRKAIEQASVQGIAAEVAMAAIGVSKPERGNLNAIWLAARDDRSVTLVMIMTHFKHEQTRLAALHVLASHPEKSRGETDNVLRCLQDSSLMVRRAAAEALGRIGDSRAVPAILNALADSRNDRVLDHSLTYALIEIADPVATRQGLFGSPSVCRAVLVALEHMPNGGLDADTLIKAMNRKERVEKSDSRPALQETVWWIAGRHPEWGERFAGYFAKRLKDFEKLTPTEQEELAVRIAFFQRSQAIRKVVGDVLAGLGDPASQRSILRALARSGLKAFPAEWNDGVLRALRSADNDTVRDAISVLRSVPASGLETANIIAQATAYRHLAKIQTATELDYSLRAAAPPGTLLDLKLATEAIGNLHRDRSGTIRAAAADLLTRAAIPAESIIALAKALETAYPSDVGKLLPVFSKTTDEKVGLSVVAALSVPAMRSVIRTEMVKPIFDKYPKPVRDEAEKLYALLAEARKSERERLEALVKQIPPGDIRRGQLVFNGAKGQCVACHKIGYVGGTVGPDLTRIGGIRGERDLLESIVFPSASFVRSYEPMKVVTTTGRSLNGILKKDAPDEIILVVAADKEERIARGDIEEITPSSVSIMPAGFDQQLGQQEIADLIAFLKACK